MSERNGAGRLRTRLLFRFAKAVVSASCVRSQDVAGTVIGVGTTVWEGEQVRRGAWRGGVGRRGVGRRGVGGRGAYNRTAMGDRVRIGRPSSHTSYVTVPSGLVWESNVLRNWSKMSCRQFRDNRRA